MKIRHFPPSLSQVSRWSATQFNMNEMPRRTIEDMRSCVDRNELVDRRVCTCFDRGILLVPESSRVAGLLCSIEGTRNNFFSPPMFPCSMHVLQYYSQLQYTRTHVRTHGHTDTRTQGHTDTRTHEYTCKSIYRSTSECTSRCRTVPHLSHIILHWVL